MAAGLRLMYIDNEVVTTDNETIALTASLMTIQSTSQATNMAENYNFRMDQTVILLLLLLLHFFLLFFLLLVLSFIQSLDASGTSSYTCLPNLLWFRFLFLSQSKAILQLLCCSNLRNKIVNSSVFHAIIRCSSDAFPPPGQPPALPSALFCIIWLQRKLSASIPVDVSRSIQNALHSIQNALLCTPG